MAKVVKNKVKFMQEVRKKYGSFVDSIEGVSDEELVKNIKIYAKHLSDTAFALEKLAEDEKMKPLYEQLNSLKEIIAEHEGPFNDSIKALQTKLNFLYLLCDERNIDTK